MKETDYAWLAGLFEGDGTVGTYKNKNSLGSQFYISNCDLRIIIKARNILEDIVKHSVSFGVENGVVLSHPSLRKGYYVGVVKQADLIAILKTIEPYLIGKRDQVKVMLEMLCAHKKGSSYTEKEKNVVKVLKELKYVDFANLEEILSEKGTAKTFSLLESSCPSG